MQSPRSMFSGVISLGPLVNIPITVAKATGETRESSLVTVCQHGDEAVKIDRSERCSKCGGSPQNKAHAVEVEEGVYRVFEASEFASIEEATKSPSINIIDVKPVSSLPLMFSLGTYYVRTDEKAKGNNLKPFAALCKALALGKMALVAKWGANATHQKLAFINIEDGVMILRVTPFVQDIRPAAKQERAHWKQQVSQREVAKVAELLSEISKTGSRWQDQQDEGLRLRTEAVERIMNDEEVEIHEAPEVIGDDDWFAKIDKAIEEVRS